MGKKSALSRTIIIKFSLTRNKALAAMAGVLLCVAAVDLGCETLTLTTYYPAPYGVYSKMRVTNYSQSGPTGQVIRTGDINGLGGIPGGSRGIYSENTDLVMGSVRDTRNQPARDAWIQPARDARIQPRRDALIQPTRKLILNPQGVPGPCPGGRCKEVEFGNNVYIKDFCKWKSYTTGSGVITYCNGSWAASKGWSVFMSANTRNQVSTAFIDDNNGITRAVFIMAKVGRMLCCRGRTQ